MQHPKQSISLAEFRRRLAEFIGGFQGKDPEFYQRALEASAHEGFFEYRDLKPVLVKALQSSPKNETRLEVAKFLAAHEPPLEEFLKVTNDRNQVIRRIALDVLLSSQLERVPEAVPLLLKTMKDNDPELRRSAIGAWRGMGHDLASAAVSALIEALSDKEKAVRLEALSTLAWLGQEAVSAVRALLDVVDSDPEEAIREAAIRALLVIDPEHGLIQPYLTALQGASTQEVLLRALRKLGPEARALRRGLQEAWGAGRGQDLPHPDGPEPPDKFWFRGKGYDIPPIPCKLLACLWGKDKVLIEEAAQAVWGKSELEPNQLKSALRAINSVLEEAKSWSYGIKKGYLVKK
jgi:HEAT repeat protein